MANEFDLEVVVNETLRRLDPILNRKFKDHEDAMTAQMSAIRAEMQRESQAQKTAMQQHHASNTVRLDTLAESGRATQATVERVENRVDNVADNVMDLLGEVRSWAGKQLGEAESDEEYEERHKSRMTALKWLGGLIPFSALVRWLQVHFHWK